MSFKKPFRASPVRLGPYHKAQQRRHQAECLVIQWDVDPAQLTQTHCHLIRLLFELV